MTLDGFRWESHAESRVKFMIPDTWTTTKLDDKTSRCSSPNNTAIEFRFFTGGAPEALADESKIADELKELATDLVIRNKPTKFSQHGLSGFGFGGTGKHDDKTIAWFSVTIGDQRGHGVLAFGFGEVDPFKTEYQTILQIMQSIQPIVPS
jgi:hypothetical protein